ncbi:Dabb family protein [Effusibacillus dendaii]|uniref:Stress responsive protein n=1 Tax=Effusibacillus dendaii TaxID=2743772 RepID=A0A7I8D9K0_9BACL|nr:Dabb family protein [Effusibacillus dendaii]BCJ86828.1 stress responsive protein [Effusibacillus dendaii]
MVEHLVLFKFSETTTNEQKDAIIAQARQLKEAIPGIVDLKCGRNFSDRSKGFEVGLSVRFENRQALEAYGPHPKHQELVAKLREIGMQETIVVDFPIE